MASNNVNSSTTKTGVSPVIQFELESLRTFTDKSKNIKDIKRRYNC